MTLLWKPATVISVGINLDDNLSIRLSPNFKQQLCDIW